MVVDLFLVYKFVRRLASDFKDWDAYKLGIIDEDGNILIKRKNFTNGEQRRAFSLFDLLILNLKKQLGKIPGGSSKFASYSAALFLLREWNEFTDNPLLTEETTERQIDESIDNFLNTYVNYITIEENVNSKNEEIANNVGSGQIAGAGVGPDGEPGVPVKKRKKKLKDLMVKRGIPDVKRK